MMLVLMPAEAFKYVIASTFGGRNFVSVFIYFTLNFSLLLAVLTGYLATFKIADECLAGRSLDLNSAFVSVLDYWMPSAWTLLLMGSFMLLGGLPAFLVAGYFHLSQQTVLYIVLPVFVMLPAGVLTICWIFAFNAVLCGDYGFKALRRSFALVRRNPLRVARCILQFLVISVVLAFLVALPVTVLLRPFLSSKVRGVFFNVFSGSIIMPWQIIFTTVAFRQFEAEKDASSFHD